ncbi:biotin--[acetyl-CoA-carboxylase] ligase [Fibrobacter sp.]|uniref:biotin--[acetyl-CoA-carboxylase] ligase n=1 Tax=Fibrobacter sp. TaxID=35828 RepID=UPI00388F6D9F
MFSSEIPFEHWKLSGFESATAFLFPQIESTHSLMKTKAVAGDIAPGALIVADSQSAGRGRHERTWDSPAGKNLYFNILVPLDGIAPNSFAQITQVTALTFAEVFNTMGEQSNGAPAGDNGERITVKWPNDILFGKSKFCGILAEIVFVPAQSNSAATPASSTASCATTAPQRKPALSLGVGINVNSDPADYAHLGRSVTTLKAIFKKQINREKLLRALVASLERAIGQFKAFGISPWVNAWRKMDQFIGCRGTIVVNNNCTDANRNSGEGSIKKSGCILDMNPDGSLLFKTDDGEVQTVYSADLEI